MGTEKRERQKANRQKGREEAARQERRQRSTRWGVIIGGAIVAVFLIVFVVGRLTGGDDDSTAVSDTVAPTAESLETVPTTEAPVLTEPASVSVPTVELDPDEVIPDGCPPAAGTDTPTQSFSEAPPFCLDPAIDYTAVITTNLGVIHVALDQATAPNTVNSFVFLARNDYFNETVCHRMVRDFVVQCGDPTATGSGGPGYTTDDELPEAGQYQIGSLAMANSGPNTQGSQFFIITGPQGAALPPSYSLFGQVDPDDLALVEEMNQRGSADNSGTPLAEVRLIDVQIATAAATS